MNSRKTITINRIRKDLEEIAEFPLEGIGIASIDNDIMKYVVNMKLIQGPYKNYCVQLLLIIPENYPFYPPKILIYPNQLLDQTYHKHIFEDTETYENETGFKKLCVDLVHNDFLVEKEKTGWNSSYTIGSLLLQVQYFLSDPSLNEEEIEVMKKEGKIDQLLKSMNKYQKMFKIKIENNQQIVKLHTWNNPYPEIYFSENDKIKKENYCNEQKNNNKFLIKKMQEIKDNLTCFVIKNNFIDDNSIILGYPIIKIKYLNKKEKYDLFPIPELISKEAFNAQIIDHEEKLSNYFDKIHFKSANNQYYDFWLAIYINENNYSKNKEEILKSFNVIVSENMEEDIGNFNPDYIFKILPNILNKMIIRIILGKKIISYSFIRCYFQYILMFKALSYKFEDEYIQYCENILTQIENNNYNINKNIVPDIGNFVTLLLFSNYTYTEKMKKMIYYILEEFLIRQMSWIFHGDECRIEMKKLVLKGKWPLFSDTVFTRFEKDESFDMNNINNFNEDLKNYNIYDSIQKILCLKENYLNDNEKNILLSQNKIDNFKYLFNKCNEISKKKIKKLILRNLNFSNYFKIENEKDFYNYKEYTEIYDELYDSYRVEELLKKNTNIQNIDEIVKYAFKSQRGNILLLITFYTKKIIESKKKFMAELNRNYGVYLEPELFIEEINSKIKEIKTYKQLYEFIGTNFGEKKTDIELIIEAYEKAKQKEYILIPNKFNTRNI